MPLRRLLPLVLGICVAWIPVSSADAIDKEKQSAIIRLIGKSGGLNAIKAIIPQMTAGISDAMKQSNPNIPPRALEILAQETNRISLTNENIGYMILATAEIYDRHFTHQEIKDLNAFYGTAVGKKMVEVMPTILQESLVAGQKWGERLLPKIIEATEARWKKEGVFKK